jgi:hypothetical protein
VRATDEDLYELGRLVGKAIFALFQVLARIDGESVQDAIDEWVSTYIADRIIEGD